MLSIYNFLKVKLCYRTYWKQWLAFLTMCFLVFACSEGDEDNVIDDPIIGTWKGILHQNTPDETEHILTFMSNGILTFSSVDEIEEGTTTHSYNCGGEWYNASSNIDFSILTQRYYVAFDNCVGEGVDVVEPQEINFVFNDNFTSFSVQNEEVIYAKQ